MGAVERVCVIVPNFNGARQLPACLDALARQTRLPDEVIVVDNGSRDGSAEMARSHLIAPSIITLAENMGFAAAANAGIRAADATYVAFLNNDAVAEPRWLEEAIKALAVHQDLSGVASLMLQLGRRDLADNAGDSLGPDGRPVPRGRDRRASGHGAPVLVPSVCGGAAVFRRRVFDEMGLFEESFFAYLEDLDFGLRCCLAGHDFLFCPASVVFHQGAGTDLGDKPGKKPMDSARRVFLIGRNRVRLLARNLPARTLAARAPMFLYGLAKGFGHHLLRSGQYRAFLAGLREGFASWSEDRKHFYTQVAPHIVPGRLPMIFKESRPWRP